MYWKHKIYIYLCCVLITAQTGFSKTIFESIREVLSFKVPENIFSSINEGIVGKLDAKNIRFFLPNKVEMDDVEVLDEHGERVLYGKHVTLTISLISLLTNNIRITDAIVDSPFFRYTIINKVHNVISPFESPPSAVVKPDSGSAKSKIRVTIEKVTVENGSYEMYHDAGVEIFAEGIAAKGSFWVEQGPFGVDISKVTIERGGVLAGGMDLPITNLVASDLWISDQKVSTNNLVAIYEKAKVVASGTVFIDEARYDLSATIDAPKGTYPVGLSPLPFVAPAFNARAKVTGPLTDPEILADVEHLSTDFRGIKIKEGRAEVQINQHQVVVHSSRIGVGHRGIMWGSGAVDIDRGSYDFITRQEEIAALDLARFLSLEQNAEGSIDAESKFGGSFVGTEQNLEINTQGTISSGVIDKLILAKKTKFDIRANIVFDKSIKISAAKVQDTEGFSVKFHGQGDLPKKAFNFSFDLFCHEVNRYYSLPNSDDSVAGLSAKGQIAFSSGVFSLNTYAIASGIHLAKFRANDVKGDIEFIKDHLRLSDIFAKFYGGTLTGNLAIDDFGHGNRMSGDATLEKVDTLSLSRQLLPVSIAGKLSAQLKIAGTLLAPDISFLSETEDLAIDLAHVKNSQIEGRFFKNQLIITRLFALTKSGSFDSNSLFLDFATKKIAGRISANNLSIASLFSDYSDRIDGFLDGPINISGTLISPSITAPLIVKKLQAYGIKLGGGALTLALERRPLIGPIADEDLVFSVSANLDSASSATMARFSIALNRKTINADINFDDIEVKSTDLGIFDQYAGLAGRVSGNFAAEGPVGAPILSASVMAKEYYLFDPKLRKDAIKTNNLRGPAVIFANSKNGKLKVDLCASFLEPALDRSCTADSSLVLSLSGPFAVDAFSLDVKGSLDYAHIEDVIFPLKNELATLDGAMRVNGKFVKKKGQKVSYRADLQIDRLLAGLPNIPQIKLQHPVSLTVSDGDVELNNDAVLGFSPGELTIKGSYSYSAVDLHLHGAIPLMLSRLFAPIIQKADGLAKGSITLSGATDAMMVEGDILFEPGASIVLRKWLEPIDIKEGRIFFEKTSAQSFLTTFDKIRLTVGDGKISMNGSFDKQYAKNDGDRTSTFNLDIQGSNIVMRDHLDFIETDFKIKTNQNDNGLSLVNGEVIVTDGSAHRQFDLRNFVAQAKTTAKAGIFKALNAIDMQIAVDIAVRQFRASARMLNIDLEANLRGHLTAEGPISQPKFKGSLTVNEGAIIFPSTSFDLLESQIVFDETSPKVFDPKIDIVATQELSPENYWPEIKEDTTVELSIKGDLDRLNLELRPIRNNPGLTKLKIFLLLLSPRSITGLDSRDQFDVLRKGAQKALAAVSGEVFLRPLTNELQELLEGQTKTRIQFGSALEPGGVTLRLNWKLGPRIELQGSYMYLSEEARKGGLDKSATFIDNYPLGDLKLKLLLFDHKPMGPLFFESSFGSTKQVEGRYEPRGIIRLKYQVLSK